jgi:hypothetical protein
VYLAYRHLKKSKYGGDIMVKEIIKRIFKLMGLKIQKDLPQLWNDVADFQLLFEEIKVKTVVHQDRCFMLYQLARYANAIDGEVAEVGACL